MSGAAGSSQWMYAHGFDIDQSLRFDRARDCSLSKTFASAGNRRTFTNVPYNTLTFPTTP